MTAEGRGPPSRTAGSRPCCAPGGSRSRRRCSPRTARTPTRCGASRRGCAGSVDAANCTDNPAARPHLSPLAAGRFVAEAASARSSSSPAATAIGSRLQADLLGAAALGARDVLLLTGDDVSAGDHPEAKPIFDLDSLHLLRIARVLRDAARICPGGR